MNRLITLTIVALLTMGQGLAQTIPPTRIGISGGLNLNPLSPSVRVWRGFTNIQPQLTPFMNDSLRFTSGSMGLGGAIGVIAGFPITRTIHISGRIGYNSMSGSATAQQIVAPTTVDHDLNVFSSMLEIAPVAEFYGLFGGLSLHPLVGFEFGLPLATTVTQSATATEQNTETTQTLASDTDIPANAVRAALILGFGYTIRLDSSWYMQPEISYRLALSDVSSNVSYSPTSFGQIRIGVNIFFGFSDSKETPKTTRHMTASVDRITAYDHNGQEVNVSSLNVEDVRYNEMFPLVPYVFAQENSLPDTVSQSTDMMPEKGDFQTDNLPLDAIEVNKNLLNIIGSRMKKIAHATLTITGTTDGKTEAKSKDLAERRAEWARNYLVTKFAIDPTRITTRTSLTPSKPSSSTDPDGIAENRRIEFESNVPDILTPIVITADNQRVSSPDAVTFHAKIESEDSLASWSLNVMQAGRSLREINGNGRPERISWPIRPNELSADQVPVDYELVVRSTSGDSATAIGSIPVDYVSSVRKKTENLPDRTIDKYSLILFDFDKSTLTEDNNRILEQMVLPNISSNSKVRIVGYTDRIGNDMYNQRLSLERAQTVKSFLQSRAKDATFSTSGVGAGVEIYPNDRAVGRQLSRTVQVIVETPRR